MDINRPVVSKIAQGARRQSGGYSLKRGRLISLNRCLIKRPVSSGSRATVEVANQSREERHCKLAIEQPGPSNCGHKHIIKICPSGQSRIASIVKPLLKCPLPYLVRNVPFLRFGICLFLLCPVSGCGRSGALRRAWCGAFRAQRRPQPETGQSKNKQMPNHKKGTFLTR